MLTFASLENPTLYTMHTSPRVHLLANGPGDHCALGTLPKGVADVEVCSWPFGFLALYRSFHLPDVRSRRQSGQEFVRVRHDE